MMQKKVGDKTVELPLGLQPVKYIRGDDFRAPAAFFDCAPDRGGNRGLPVNKTDFYIWPSSAERLCQTQQEGSVARAEFRQAEGRFGGENVPQCVLHSRPVAHPKIHPAQIARRSEGGNSSSHSAATTRFMPPPAARRDN
jgi:hypothetical protein